MKIKNISIGLIVLFFIVLSSCNEIEEKEKYGRFSEDFVGEYILTVTPTLKISSQEYGEQDFPIAPMEEVPCTIDQCDLSNNGVHIYPGRSADNIKLIGNCDKNGMYIYESNLTINTDTEEFGTIKLELTMPTTSPVEAPESSYISMQVSVSGNVSYTLENDTIATIATISGDIIVSGIKLESDDERMN